MNQDYDVIVVGAGPGGATTARLCAQAGLKTVLLEKQNLPRYKPCGGCLSLKSVALAGFDLTPVTENVIYGIQFTYRLKDPLIVRSKEPVALMVMRDRFDQFLVDRAVERGVLLLEGEEVTDAAEEGGGVRVETGSGKRFRCGYVVGADGPGSIVGRSHISSPSRNGWGIAVESEIPLEWAKGFPREHPDFIHLDFGGVPNGYGWVFPKRERLSVGVGGMIREGGKLDARRYYTGFIRRLEYFDEAKTERIVGHSLPSFYDPRQKVSRGRCLLVGDAAHLMDPLMGEGIYYALRSGMLAAEAIIQSKEKGILPSELYQSAVQASLFQNLNWALRLSRFVFRFTKLAYLALKRHPELADLYLDVLNGKETYSGFVTTVKGRMKDLLKGDLGEKIRRAMVGA